MPLYVNPTNLYISTSDPEAFKDARRKQALEELEHFFAYTLLKEMRKTVPEGGLFKPSQAQKFQEEMLDDALSGVMAKGGHLGIAKMVDEQLRIGEMQAKLHADIAARRAKDAAGAVQPNTTIELKETAVPADDMAEPAGGTAP